MKKRDLNLSITQVEVYQDIDLSSYTTMKLVAKGDLIKVFSVNALREVLLHLNAKKIPYDVLGWGANTLIDKRDPPVFIKLDFKSEVDFSKIHDEYSLPASYPLNKLTAHAIKFGLKGWECFTGIPATLGGAIYMNAGTSLGEMKNIIKNVQVMDSKGDIREVKNKEGMFSYRKNNFLKKGEVILGGTLVHKGIDPSISDKIKEYIAYRGKTQPLATKNCGCVFKNKGELGAGMIIDRVGLKGLSYKNLKVSNVHANFIEHYGDCDLHDFHTLVSYIKLLTFLYTGQKIECEVQYPYNDSNENIFSHF